MSSYLAPWKTVLRTNFTNIEKLALFLELSQEDKSRLLSHSKFILNLPLRLASKIKKGTLDDPLLRQFVPLDLETEVNPQFVADPVQDFTFVKTEKLLQKYQTRALVISTSACAMHCRYCFRQNFPYETERKGFEEELKQIRENTSLQEIILSGGDPLSLSDEILGSLLNELDAIPHIKRIRFHSRFPIGIPERIDASFLSLVSSLKKQIWFVTHANHAAELDQDVLGAFKALQKLGATVMNQAVLLKGVNDSVEALRKLAETLGDNGIVFYYLHQLDRVQGAAHFEVEEKQGLEIIKELQASASGYLVPKYVQEIAGKPSKTYVLPN